MNKQYLKKGVYHASFELIENEFSLRATENYYLDVKFFLNEKITPESEFLILQHC